ncbi:MAG: AMP-binding protein [Alphaproteobacteria bacterium]|nr:AMP-binding protein [Alphaproteobacteria bacterium]
MSADTLGALLAEHVATRPQAPALHYQGEALSYAGLADRVARVAQGLSAAGIGAGDRVGLWLPNTPAYLVLNLALARIGAIALAVNTRFRSVEVADIVGRSGARALVLWPGFHGIDFLAVLADVDPAALAHVETLVLYDEGEPARSVPAAVGHCRRIAYRELEASPPGNLDRSGADVGCNLFTTSGTTKAPKFVLHTQGSLSRHGRAVARAFGYVGAQGAAMQVLPLCGVFGHSQAMASFAGGRPMVLMSTWDPAAALTLIDRYDVRHMNASDEMLAGLLAACPRPEAFPRMGPIGFASFTGNPELALTQAARRGLTLVGLYGMSEVQALYARQPVDAPAARRALGGGLPVSSAARARARDPQTGEVLPHGQAGELELAGPSLMREYFGNPWATCETLLADGFLRTGDLGYTTGDGGFVYLSRMGDVLRLGGFLVSPVEIESHLETHAAVAGAQVVGVVTAEGPRAVAFVVLRPGQTADETALRAHCLAGLAKYKAPVRFVPLPEFPSTKSANGTKIQRGRLREMAKEVLSG